MIYRIFIDDIKKVFSNKYIYLSVFITFMILMVSNIYTDETGKTYNILTAIINFDTRKMSLTYYEMSRQCIMGAVVRGRIEMFAPLLTLMPLMQVLVMERSSGVFRFQLIRTGVIKYVLGKMCTALFCGGFVTMISYILLDIFTRFYFCDMPNDLPMIEAPGFAGYSYIGWFVFGAANVVMGFLLTAFMDNYYLIFCLPFIINYLVLTLLGDEKISGLFEIKIGRDRLQPFGMFKTINLIDAIENHSSLFIFNIGFFVFSIVFAVAVWMIVLFVKTDSGE